MPSFQLAQQPRDIGAFLSDFLQQGNEEGILSLFHPDCQIFFPPTKPPRVGKEAVRVVFGPTFVL